MGIIETGVWVNSPRYIPSHVNGTTLYQKSEIPLIWLVTSAPPSKINMLNLTLENMECELPNQNMACLLGATQYLDYDYAMDLELNGLVLKNSYFRNSALYSPGKGRLVFRNISLKNVYSWIVFYCYRCEYIDFYDIDVSESRIHKFFRV